MQITLGGGWQRFAFATTGLIFRGDSAGNHAAKRYEGRSEQGRFEFKPAVSNRCMISPSRFRLAF